MERYAYSDELYHYGRKGMKWHQHIFGKDNKNSSGAKKKKASELDRLKKRAIEKHQAKKQRKHDESQKKQLEKKETRERLKADMKSPKKMSDAELKSRIERLKMEKDYKDLLNNTSGISKGKKFVANVLEKSGESLAIQVVNHLGSKGLNKMFGEEVIFANNKKKG